MIKKPIQSEKANNLLNKGVYTFLVDPKSSKKDIAVLVSKQFSVTVKKVNVSKFAPKTKRIGKTRKFTYVGGGKKAIVWLAEGQSIAMLSPKAEPKTKKTKKEKDVQLTSADGKEA